ncbi:MAG: NADH-quinone oxidoreductase subunit J [Candidatus Sericytochromatia bacterium]|nr:NADH-quinone oxidoreductase subunit J [Candidatus Tanganyikabacteria bacterium]
MLDAILFAVLSAVAVAGALAMVSRRHPLGSALALIVVMIALAGLYALLAAPLVAILQILVYGGAILALIVFVIMLLNVREEDLAHEDGLRGRLGMGLTVAGLLFMGLAAGIHAIPADPFAPPPPGFGGIVAVGRGLFRDYAVPFEVVSLLLTVAVVSAVGMAKRRLD